MARFKKFSFKQARPLLPRRRATAHKASAGRALIIAGSRGMYGAAVLAATAAARVGSGYVRVMTDAARFPSAKHPDFLTIDWRTPVARVPFDAVGIGPGLGVTPRSRRLTKELKTRAIPNVVLDADALRICADQGWRDLPSSWVMTPHEGELGRLLKVSADVIRQDRRAAVVRARDLFGCHVLLKGHRTLIASSDGACYEIQSGNAALAKAGTGDVLTGMITGLIAQGLTSLDAACLAAFAHGCVADDWVRSGRDVLSLMASDVVDRLPETLARIRRLKLTTESR